jgi:hypothetical protein
VKETIKSLHFTATFSNEFLLFEIHYFITVAGCTNMKQSIFLKNKNSLQVKSSFPIMVLSNPQGP